jgi:hypothetical protein
MRCNFGESQPIEALWGWSKRKVIRMYGCIPGGPRDCASFVLEQAWRRVNAWYEANMTKEDYDFRLQERLTEIFEDVESVEMPPTRRLANQKHGQEHRTNNIDLHPIQRKKSTGRRKTLTGAPIRDNEEAKFQ